MDTHMRDRISMSALGAMAGISLYLLAELLEQDILPARVGLALGIFLTVFFTAVLILTGPLRLAQAARGASVLALVAAGLLSWAGLRFDDVGDLFNAPMHAMATFAICALPLPFVMGWYGKGLRDYPTLFFGAWGIIVRGGTAMVFTGLVWGVIMLCDLLLGIVGLTLIADLLSLDVVPWLICGATLGLALAVVEELRDYISPNLILRLVRLLVPVVLVVMIVFCVALPFQGFAGVFDAFSAAATLLTMAGAGTTLVSVALDQDDERATQSPLLAQATRALAVVLPVPAALGAYAVWLRVAQYGWTPERLFAALCAAFICGYALLYCAAVLQRGGWMGRVRQANIAMAGVVIAVAAAWLSPLLNAERISANSQSARFSAGRMTTAEIAPSDYQDWGTAGASLLAQFAEKAKEPGQEALQRQLASASGDPLQGDANIDALRASLNAQLPVRPTSAAAARDLLVSKMDVYDVGTLMDGCRMVLPDGKPGCVMIFADLLPEIAGDEAMVGTFYGDGYGNFELMYVLNGDLMRQAMQFASATQGTQGDAARMIAALQSTDPRVSPVPLNRLDLDGMRLTPFP